MPNGYTRASVRSCGEGAAELWAAVLSEHERRGANDQPWSIGEVRQVYDRSAYIELHRDAIDGFEPLGPPLVLLAGEGFDGPLATRLAGSGRDVISRELDRGRPCRLRTAAGNHAEARYVLRLGETIDVELEAASLETMERDTPQCPALTEITPQGPNYNRAAETVQLLRDGDREDGLGWLGPLDDLATGGIARTEPRSLIEWWVAYLQGCADGRPPIDLLGRGPGATPSGDDILAGLLLALYRTTSRQRHERVRDAGRALVAAAAERTTAISAALLAQAAQGRAGGRFDAALGSILAAEPDQTDWQPAVFEAAELGHTSGLDHLVGLLLAVLGIAPEITD
ncbi:MAG: DUF2877 domain-containing protein [Halobacteriales archaeon]